MDNSAARPAKPSSAWSNFTYFSTAASILVSGYLIITLPIDSSLKIAIGAAFAWAMHNSVNVTKNLRDDAEYKDWEQLQNNQNRQAATRPEVSKVA